MPRKKERDPEATWYTATEISRILDMNSKTFRRNVEKGLFPHGVVRPGEKLPRWSEDDLRDMQYRFVNAHRFFEGDSGITEDEE